MYLNICIIYNRETDFCGSRVSIVDRKASQTMSTFFPPFPKAALEAEREGLGYIVVVVSSSLRMTKYFNE